MTDPDVWVPVAQVARPHGVQGELRLKVFNTSSDILLGLEEVLVRLADGQEHEVSVERARRADDAVLMKLFSIDSRDRADELRGAQICVRRRDFPAADDGEFYAVDVVGAEARLDGVVIGTVGEIISYPTVEVMLVKAADCLGNWEIPLTETYIGKIDLAAQTVEVLSIDELERLPVKKSKKRGPDGKRLPIDADAMALAGNATAAAATTDDAPVNGAATDDEPLT